jgi:hypothetical protein
LGGRGEDHSSRPLLTTKQKKTKKQVRDLISKNKSNMVIYIHNLIHVGGVNWRIFVPGQPEPRK